MGRQFILKLMVEVKAVPTSVVKRKADERAQEIEAATGRKPGKKETRELRVEAKLTLLPMAFAKRGSVTVWLDVEAQRLVIDAASQGRADEVITCLVKALGGLSLATGAVLEVVTASTGYVLVMSGKTIAFLPNEAGKALLHHARAI